MCHGHRDYFQVELLCTLLFNYLWFVHIIGIDYFNCDAFIISISHSNFIIISACILYLDPEVADIGELYFFFVIGLMSIDCNQNTNQTLCTMSA